MPHRQGAARQIARTARASNSSISIAIAEFSALRPPKRSDSGRFRPPHENPAVARPTDNLSRTGNPQPVVRLDLAMNVVYNSLRISVGTKSPVRSIANNKQQLRSWIFALLDVSAKLSLCGPLTRERAGDNFAFLYAIPVIGSLFRTLRTRIC